MKAHKAGFLRSREWITRGRLEWIGKKPGSWESAGLLSGRFAGWADTAQGGRDG
jgi:hypothetical protein